MAKKRKIVVSAISVRVHPHSTEGYVNLLVDAFRLRQPINVRGDQYMIMRRFESTGNEREYYGFLTRFTKLENDSPWFDIETFDEAEKDIVASINIPPQIRPNMVSLYFSLFPAKHLIVFETDSHDVKISPRIFARYFEGIFKDAKILSKYGGVKVDVQADKTQLGRLFAIKNLKRLSIEINKPNSDHWDDDLEEDIEQRLEEENAQTLRIELVAEHGKSLTPNDRTKRVAEVAATNGRVDAYGHDGEGAPVTESTVDIPVQETTRYDPDTTSLGEAFTKAAYMLFERITGRSFE